MDPIDGNMIKEIILKKITSGEIKPKQKIKQNELANELGVSRTPIIKALNMLVAEGIVDNVPNSGYYIHQFSLREVAELFEVRQYIEMSAAANAASLISEDEIKYLHSFFSQYCPDMPIDKDSYYESDKGFHRYLRSFCRNKVLIRIENTLQIYERALSFGLIRKPADTLSEHIEIINAIETRDPMLAKNKMMLHLEQSITHLRSTVEQLGSIGIDPDTIHYQSLISEA